MKISVVIACRNEERDLEGTIIDLCRGYWPVHEVIVVDDASNNLNGQSMTERVIALNIPEVRVIRLNEQVGAGPAKRVGCLAATGDVIVISDSHMQLPDTWCEAVVDAVNEYPTSIFCTTCETFNGRVIGSGARFDRRSPFGLGRLWKSKGSDDEIDEVPCILGAFYIIPRRIGEAIDWINPHFIGWGCGEQDLSLKAMLAGFGVRRINSLRARHRFGRYLQNVQNMGWHNTWNGMVLTLTLLGRKRFDRDVWPTMKMMLDTQRRSLFAAAANEISTYGQQLAENFVYEPDELKNLCGFRWPNPDENVRAVATSFARKAKARRRIKMPPAIGERHLIAILDAIPPGGRLLEWGSGGSTAWFRSHVADDVEIVSVEHDPDWAKKVGNVILHEMPIIPGKLSAERLPGEDRPCVDPTIPYAACEGLGPFDVVLIDGVLRNACMAAVGGLGKPGGRVFVHDAQRDWYVRGFEIMSEHVDEVRLWRSCTDYVGPRLWEGRIK